MPIPMVSSHSAVRRLNSVHAALSALDIDRSFRLLDVMCGSGLKGLILLILRYDNSIAHQDVDNSSLLWQ